MEKDGVGPKLSFITETTYRITSNTVNSTNTYTSYTQLHLTIINISEYCIMNLNEHEIFFILTRSSTKSNVPIKYAKRWKVVWGNLKSALLQNTW